MKLASIIVPCRNEAAHIEAFCASAAAQSLPAGWSLEVVVADGASDDGTRRRLDALAARDARFVVIDNPARIVSAGLNRALAAARGEVIVRMDVHTVYAADYVAACLATLERTRRRQRRRAVARRCVGERAATRCRRPSPPPSSRAGWPAARARASSTTRARSTPSTSAAGRAPASTASAASTSSWCATRTTSTTCASSRAAGGSGSRARSDRRTGRGRRSAGCGGSTCSTATGSRS